MPEPQVSVFVPPTNPSPAQPAIMPGSGRVPSSARADGVRSDPPMSEPERRWRADFDANTKSDPWRDPNIVITKDADGTLRTRPRDGATSTSNGTPAAAEQQQQPQQPTPGPASVDGNKLRIGEIELSEGDIRGLLERKATEDSRRALMPADPANYELKLPDDFKVPEGLDWTWNLENPTSAATIGLAKQFAHQAGLSQDQFSRMMGLYVSNQLAEQRMLNTAKAAEVAKLGAAAPTRVDAVNTFLQAMVGTEHATALRRNMFTAKQVEAYERIMSRFVSQGVSGNPGGARDGAHGREPARLTDEQYSRLSYAEKEQYARQFDQSQFTR
jgi:hypothetical protein